MNCNQMNHRKNRPPAYAPASGAPVPAGPAADEISRQRQTGPRLSRIIDGGRRWWWSDRIQPVVGGLAAIGVLIATLSARSGELLAPVADSRRSTCCARPASRRARHTGANGGSGSYARYSSDGQRDESIAQQQRKCREQAIANGHTIEGNLEFADQAVSGTKLNRTGLNAMLAAAESGQISVLYLHSLSRLARESVITLPLLKRLVFRHGVRVISLADGLDTDRDDWTVIAAVMALMHERYIKELSENVRRGQEDAVLAGFSVGDYCFGFASEPVPGSEAQRAGRNGKPRMQYVIDIATAAWVVRIFYWHVKKRRSISWIAMELTRRGAPKDHRSSTPGWHHDLVRRVLSNPKYRGHWPWGESRNVRDPETGQLSQEPRPEEEAERFTRHFPHLQIIDEARFAEAQRLLKENAEKFAPHRAPSGHLHGAPEGGAGQPAHLLQGLIVCGACGGNFQVVSTRHLACRNCTKFGTCACSTRLNRDRAEGMILDALGRRMLADGAWAEAAFAALLAAWQERSAERPSELRAARDRLREIRTVVDNLLGAIERGLEDPDVAERLRQRRGEERELRRRIEQLEHEEQSNPPQPTREWFHQQLQHLSDALRETGPSAAIALGELLGGAIEVEEIHDGDRRFLRGTLNLHPATLVQQMHTVTTDALALQADEPAEQIILDFIKPPLIVEQSEEAKRLRDRGTSCAEIGRQLGIGTSRVTAVLHHWYESRGLPVPDGRSSRVSNQEPAYRQIAPQVKALYQADRLIAEIAAEVGFNRATIEKTLRYLQDDGQLELEDGRTRRKRLTRKSRTPAADRR